MKKSIEVFRGLGLAFALVLVPIFVLVVAWFQPFITPLIIMEFGFVHADPHPGNTVVMRDGRAGLVDFGITAHLDEELMIQIARLFLGYAEHDYGLVMGSLLDAGIIDESTGTSHSLTQNTIDFLLQIMRKTIDFLH